MKLVSIPDGQFADRILEYANAKDCSALEIHVLLDQNAAGFREFWGRHAGEALELKKILETRVSVLEALEKMESL